MAQSPGAAAALRRPLSAQIMDYAMPAAILLAVAVVLAPVPAPAVDLMLAANLTISVLALLGALAARTPLELSVFPTFLLGITLVRLVLNIATTRLILSRAAIDGASAAGQVVESFGAFVAANDLVVGGVVFGIIAIVQFVVITAGATRTSEVAARFTLDGLPGRQMAIDTEVNAGTLTREQARGLRLELQRQADFFASMDGASRFVRGEAVASVIITLVNIVGGLFMGVVKHGMPVEKSLDVYARLTIGDGLSSAVPALFISVATGLLVSRSTQAVDLSEEFGRQFTARPHVLAVTGVFLALLSITGLPFLPLAGMAVVTLGAAIVLGRRSVVAAETDRSAPGRPASAARAVAAPAPRAGDTVLGDDRVVVEVGRGLVHLIGPGGRLVERVAAVRSALGADLGVVLPQVVLRDDLALPNRGYRVAVAGDVVVEAEIPAGRMLAVVAAGEAEPFEGPAATDPLTGRLATWVSHAQAESVRGRAAAVLDDAGCVARGLEAAVRRRADRLLTRDATARLIESLRSMQPAVVEQTVPAVLSVARVQRTLQCLLREGVPIRPLGELLEIMSDHAAETAEPWQLAEIVRRRMAGGICRRARDPQGRLTTVRLSAAALDTLARPARAGTPLRPPPRLVTEVRRAVRTAVQRGGLPVVAVPGAARRTVRDAFARQLPDLVVLADEELGDEDRVELFATVGSDEAVRAA